MKKYKLLYLVSEDGYFLSHKLSHAIIALENGFEVVLVCKVSKYKEKIESFGIQVKNINFDRKSLNFFKEISVLRSYIEIVEISKPDLIQSIALKPILLTCLGSFFFKKIKKIHAIVGLGYLFINESIKIKIIRKILTSILTLIFNRNDNFIVFQNKEDQEYFIKKKIVKKEKTTIIKGSGVNTNQFKPSNGVKKKYDLIMHSRMLYDKGIIELINASRILKNKGLKLKILLLGDPDIGNRASVPEIQLKLWDKSKLIEWIPAKENVLSYLRKSKIAILPSYKEGLPKSLLEAASCGLPIISTNVSGCRDICRHNYNGLLVEAKDSKSLAQSIESLYADNEKIKKMGIRSRGLVENNFSDEIISKKFLKLYLDILK